MTRTMRADGPQRATGPIVAIRIGLSDPQPSEVGVDVFARLRKYRPELILRMSPARAPFRIVLPVGEAGTPFRYEGWTARRWRRPISWSRSGTLGPQCF